MRCYGVLMLSMSLDTLVVPFCQLSMQSSIPAISNSSYLGTNKEQVTWRKDMPAPAGDPVWSS